MHTILHLAAIAATVLLLAQFLPSVKVKNVGAAIIPLLREAARRGVETDYVSQILAALGVEKWDEAQSLVEPLSEREIEVLRLVTAGLSNREIALKLVISPGTAKTHIHNLCGKLGARNRTEAAMKAKELNLA